MNFPLVGNERVKNALLAALAEDRLPHAILIEGDPGTGRHTLASFLASACLCDGNPRPCGECRGCHLNAVGTHPDLMVTAPEDGKKNISVAQIRALRAEAYVKPHLARRRVFLLDRADTMNEQAQNALLKVLEEPPGAAVFLLVAESKAALLETVLSRCTVLSLVPPDLQTAFSFLSQTSSCDPEELHTVLQETDGNIGLALARLEGDKTATVKAAAETFIAALLAGKEWEMLTAVQPFEKNRVDAERFFKELRVTAVHALRTHLQSPSKSAALARFCEELPALEQHLKTNIQLSLWFCAMTCKAAECMKK